MSEARRAASRKNGAQSLGPITPRGRELAAQNARKFGLSLPVSADPIWGQRVGKVIRQLAGGDEPPSSALVAYACALVEIERVTVAKSALFKESGFASPETLGPDPGGREVRAKHLLGLRRLHRYEKQAQRSLRNAEAALWPGLHRWD